MDFSSLGLGELDWLFVIIIVISTLLGVSRGMVREIFALVGWIAAFFISIYYSAALAEVLPFQNHMGLMVRTFVSVILIVIGCVFVSGLIGKIIRNLLASISIGAEDRLLGCLFGFLRGVLIVGLMVFIGGTSHFLSTQPWWKNSALVPVAEKGSCGSLLIFLRAFWIGVKNNIFNSLEKRQCVESWHCTRPVL